MAGALTPIPPRAARPSDRWGPTRSPSTGGLLNLVMGFLVVLGTGWLGVDSMRAGGDPGGWYLVASVLVIVSCAAQLTGELVLARSAPWSVRAGVAAVVGTAGAAVAVLFFADGHRIRSTCDSYCATDVSTGRRVEVIAVGILVYTLVTTARLVRRHGRSLVLEVAVGALAFVLPISYVVFRLLLGGH